jgi:chromate transporter
MSEPSGAAITEAPAAPPIGLFDLAGCFLKIALASFGGGLSAWSRQLIVEERRWLDDQEFLSALTLTRLLPGPNQINLAIYVGSKFRGFPGAAAAFAGLVVVPVAILIGLGTAYFHAHHVPALQSILGGAVAAAAGMALSMAVKLGIPYLRQPSALLFAGAAYFGVHVMHWQLPLVVIGLAPFSMAWFWPRGEHAATHPEEPGAARQDGRR